MNLFFPMNQNNNDEERHFTAFEVDDETDVYFLEQVYAYHEHLEQEEKRPRLTLNPIHRDREGAEERLMGDYFDDSSSIRQLAYGNTPDAFDEYLKMSEHTALSWHGQYGRGDKKYLTIMLKVVASHDLWIWHAIYEVPGANNDINVLDNSPLFDDLLDDKALVAPFVFNFRHLGVRESELKAKEESSAKILAHAQELCDEHKVLLDSSSVIFLCFLRLPRLLMLPRRFLVLVGETRVTWSLVAFNPLTDLTEMDLLSFIRTVDPAKVRISERQRDEDEPNLLETIVGRVFSLLPVAPNRSSGELEANVEKLLTRGSGEQAEQGDSAYGGHGVGIDVVAKTIVEDVPPAQLKRQKKRKTKVTDAGEPSHPVNKLRDDYKAPGGPTVGDHTELLAGANLRAIGALQRFVIFSDSSDHAGVNITEAEVDYVIRTSMPIVTSTTTTTPTADPAAIAKEKLVGSFVFGADSPSAGGSHPIPGGFSDCSGSDFLVGGICTLFTEFNVGAARQISLSVEVKMRAEYHIKEKKRLKAVVKEKNQVLKARDEEIENLKAQLLLKEAKAIRLRAETSKLVATKKSLRDEVTALSKRNTILEEERNALDVKVTDMQAVVVSKGRELTDSAAQLTSIKSHNDNLADQLYADFVEVTLHLEERFYPHILTTIIGGRWLLAHGIKLAIAKCLNSLEYLSALGIAVSKAIEKGMQDGLAAGITHGREGRVLTNVAAHNPAAKADYDASIKTVMNILRLKEHLATRLGLNESQPHVDQLMVPIHHSLDKTVIGAFALSLALDVSNALPLSVAALTGIEGTSVAAPAIANLTTALSVTLASASIVTPHSVDDYRVMGTDDQLVVNESVVDEDANPFPNGDDAELNIRQ
nr:hypothetical protein [Tanacetum cinerariifolium]